MDLTFNLFVSNKLFTQNRFDNVIVLIYLSKISNPF